MTDLTNTDSATNYGDLITVLTPSDSGSKGLLPSILKPLQDGLGNSSPITISQSSVNFSRDGKEFQLDSISLTATATALNSIADDNTFQGPLPLVVPHLAVEPAVTNGGIYYNTVTNELKGCANGAWTVLAP